jgi:surface antigen
MKITKQALTASILSTVILVAPNICHAIANIGTWSFLQGTPAETFNKQDWSIFEKAIFDTLDNAQDNETKTWQNPATNTSGEIKVLRSVKNSAHDCRLLNIITHAKDSNDDMELIFCRQPSGKWKIATPKVK